MLHERTFSYHGLVTNRRANLTGTNLSRSFVTELMEHGAAFKEMTVHGGFLHFAGSAVASVLSSALWWTTVAVDVLLFLFCFSCLLGAVFLKNMNKII